MVDSCSDTVVPSVPPVSSDVPGKTLDSDSIDGRLSVSKISEVRDSENIVGFNVEEDTLTENSIKEIIIMIHNVLYSVSAI